jgi:hypothetical protein
MDSEYCGLEMAGVAAALGMARAHGISALPSHCGEASPGFCIRHTPKAGCVDDRRHRVDDRIPGDAAGQFRYNDVKILPAFCGARILFSPRLMFVSLIMLNARCLLRVCTEIAAYEGYSSDAWPVLPVSAGFELAAVTIFALNLGLINLVCAHRLT